MPRRQTTASGRRRWTALLALAASLCLISPTPAAEKVSLVVYTAYVAEDLPKYKERFEKANPDIEVSFLRAGGSGDLTARLLAERDNRQADVVWGLAVSNLIVLVAEGLAEPYAPQGLQRLDARFRDAADPPAWVGLDAWVATVCVNSEEAAKAALPPIASWKDLTRPEYRGKIIMPDPAASGTGYLLVSSWLQLFGEEAAWRFMDALHDSVAFYVASGSKPCKMAAGGEYAIGLSYEYRGAMLKAEGAPLELVFPSEGLGWDINGLMIMRGTPKLEAARRMADWAISPEAYAMYAEGSSVVALPGIAKPLPGLPADLEARMMTPNDFAWAAANRDRILAEWQRRYAAKRAPEE